MDNPTQLPNDQFAERNILAAMMKDSTSLALIADHLRPSDFFDERRGYIYEAATSLVAARRIISEHTICEELTHMGKLETIGGREIIRRIATHPEGDPSHIEDYAATVVANAQRRDLIMAAAELTARAQDMTASVEDVVEWGEDAVFKIATRARDEDFTTVGDEAAKYLTQLDEIQRSGVTLTGIPTALPRLDSITGGWQKQNLIIIAAPPGVGKSSYALLAAKRAGEEGAVVGVYSLEMSKSELVSRWLAMDTGIPTDQMRVANLDDDEWQILSDRQAKMSSLPVYLNSITGLTVGQIRAKARRLKAKVGRLDFIIVDYIQIIEETKADSRRNRAEVLGNIAKSLKQMAGYFDCPVLVCAQMSRAVFSRSDNLPVMSDLKESGGLEANADMVIFLTRRAVFHPDEDDDGTALMHIAKHRNGRTGKIKLRYRRETTLFSEEIYQDRE